MGLEVEAAVSEAGVEVAVGAAEERTWRYPEEEVARLFAPPEGIDPCLKLRAMLRERFEKRHSDPRNSFTHTAGAFDALTASMLTRVGFDAIYASGWQLAVAHSMYPDIGIYPSHSMVDLVRELIRGVEGTRDTHFYDTGGEILNVPPIFADIEAGFGGPTQTFTLTRELIRAGVAGVHLEDQDPAERTCGHIVAHHGKKRPKVLVETRRWIEKLIAIRAAAQAAGKDVVIIARTDAVDGAVPGGREPGIRNAIERGLEAASLGIVDVIWPEFNDTLLDGPRQFAEAIHERYPNQMLGFNLSPSLHWGKAKQGGTLLTNADLGKLGYALQFCTLLAFRSSGMALERALRAFRTSGLEALADLQISEVAEPGLEPVTRKHQAFAGTDRWLTFEKVAKDGRK
ncbi:MAG TPA: isocitrate lyase/phosphoenolpyruvate mutase family protein [Candidatus Polarisedimenticolia bacterium]|jgi:isocitrate lyase|nr:isocitrate lyase/phosphoenolpyruvate mutase family protein [Candidatus Polarisedimenticolia bacterium]